METHPTGDREMVSTHVSHLGLTEIQMAGYKAFQGNLGNIKRLAASQGLEFEAFYKVIGIDGAVTKYDTSKITGYWLKDQNGVQGMIQRLAEGWHLQIHADFWNNN